LLLIEILASSSYDDVCPDLVHVLIAERICFSAGVEEARGSATSFSSLMQNIKHSWHNGAQQLLEIARRTFNTGRDSIIYTSSVDNDLQSQKTAQLLAMILEQA